MKTLTIDKTSFYVIDLLGNFLKVFRKKFLLRQEVPNDCLFIKTDICG